MLYTSLHHWVECQRAVDARRFDIFQMLRDHEEVPEFDSSRHWAELLPEILKEGIAAAFEDSYLRVRLFATSGPLYYASLDSEMGTGVVGRRAMFQVKHGKNEYGRALTRFRDVLKSQ